MLTSEQIGALEPLMEHPKFGKLLKEAVEIWKRPDIHPTEGISGTEFTNQGKYELTNNCCCLIGAASVNKNYLEFNDLVMPFIKEFDFLYLGFDATEINDWYDVSEAAKEAHQFGLAVRKIVIENAI